MCTVEPRTVAVFLKGNYSKALWLKKQCVTVVLERFSFVSVCQWSVRMH